MGSVRWTPEAVEWLTRIRDYLAERSPAAAAKVARGIYSQIQLLRTHPDLGYVLNSKYPMVRCILFGHYQIIYRRIDDGVEILGVFHASLNLERFFP
jgi:toxin ParE1/3/4